MIELFNWSFCQKTQNVYQAPELEILSLCGKVRGHPKIPDGEAIASSPIKYAYGRKIWTASGSIYMLIGDPEPEFVEFMANMGKAFDYDNPIDIWNRR